MVQILNRMLTQFPRNADEIWRIPPHTLRKEVLSNGSNTLWTGEKITMRFKVQIPDNEKVNHESDEFHESSTGVSSRVMKSVWL